MRSMLRSAFENVKLSLLSLLSSEHFSRDICQPIHRGASE